MKTMFNIKDVTKSLSFALVFGLVAVFFLSLSGFAFGVSINQFYPIAALVLSVVGIFLLNRDKTPIFSVVLTGVYLLILFLSAQIAVNFYDNSWDGRDYHQLAVLFLQNGWNPFYTDIISTYQTLYHNPLLDNTLLWIQKYVKFQEIVAANVFTVTGKIESGKFINYLSLSLLFLYSLYVFENPVFAKLSYKVKITLSLLTVLNPVLLAQLFTFYNDGLSYCYLILLLLTILNAELNDNFSKSDLFFLFAFAVILANIKFGGLLYLIFFFGAYFVYLFVKKQKERLRVLLKLTCLIGLVVVLSGYNPYITNIKQGYNPFHPVLGADKKDFLSPSIPRQFVGKSMPYKFFYATFSESENIKSFSANQPKLKIPFSVCYVKEFPAFFEPDVRVGGFGVFWSGILILTLYLLCVLRFKDTKEKGVFKFLIASIFLSILINPENWWARYVPHFWFLPVVIILSTLLAEPQNLQKTAAKFLIYIMIFNSLIVFYFNYIYSAKFSRVIKNICSNNSEIYMFTDNVFEVSFVQKLKENNIKLIRADFNYFLEHKDELRGIPNPFTLKTEYFCRISKNEQKN
ncbi:MAG: hypothetical protein K6C94_05725 [Candidatus Gastranaerophilales bacterium]|nr:hypothetical protein [Candidatus Gastranaerophilales bacterium]